MKRRPNPDQLDIFPPEVFMTDEQVDLAVIDAALHHVEDQSVLVKLKAGESWAAAFGIGGSTHPVSWQGDARGIQVFWAEPRCRLIKPARIAARAKEYKPINPF